jgi:hypothetical protein
MKKDPNFPEMTSRRQFTKAVVTAAVAVPVVASLSCKSEPSPPVQQAQPVAQTGPAQEACFPSGGNTEEHIPPMGFDGGGGSLLIETTGEIAKNGSYYEELNPTSDDKLGDIKEIAVITESLKPPYVNLTRYFALPPNSQLWLWYQYLKANPGNKNCDYDSPGADPVVKIQGGNKAANRPLRMIFPEDLRPKEKAFKCGHPNRYRHADQNEAHHFRVAKWRIVDGNGNVVKDAQGRPFEDSVNNMNTLPEHFRFYVTYDHYNPH